jgi:S1/P1 Nuclease
MPPQRPGPAKALLVLRLLALLLVAFALCAPSAFAWTCKGHQTVALIAEKHLTPEALQLIEQLLKDNPVDPQLRRVCGYALSDPFVDASSWPDDVRNQLKNGPWHYIDIPRGAARVKALDEYCGPEGCITRAIAEQLAIFRNASADPRKRADAIRYLVHFVGDLHMPLHATTNNDRGGNCVPVRYFRRRPREHNHAFTPNLHSVWDTEILERDMQGADPAEYSEYLDELFADVSPNWQKAGIHVDDWAWESHDLAESFVYGELAPPVPVEIPTQVHSCSDANDIGARMMRLHLYAGENYQEVAAPIVEERIAQAGVRLAMILNEAVAALHKP